MTPNLAPEEARAPFQTGPLPTAQRVLAIAPHPDDEALGCGGLLALYTRDGARAKALILSDGGFGDFGARGDREAESKCASAVLGMEEPYFARIADRQLRYNDLLIGVIADRLRDFRPDLLLVPSPWELHPDHIAASLAAVASAYCADPAPLVLLYEVSAPLPPNLLVDVSSVQETKSRSIACFASQLALQDYQEHIAALNRYRCYTLPREVRYAEGYYRLDEADLRRAPSSAYARQLAALELAGLRIREERRPAISVLIRSSGRALLEDALASVATQTYPNIEVVLVNAVGPAHPAPADRVGCFPLRYVDSDAPLGRSAAANLALDTATGRFGLFLDDDDWLLPHHLERLAVALESAPQSPVAYTGVDCLERDGADWRSVRIYDEPFEAAHLEVENFIPIHAALFRLDTPHVPRFDTSFDLFEDWDWWLQWSSLGPFLHIPGCSAIYRVHGSGNLGIVADPQVSEAALEHIVRKWHLTKDVSAATAAIAYPRRLLGALTDAQRLGDARDLEAALARSQLEAAKISYEQEIARISALLGERARVYETEIGRLEGELRTRSKVYEKEAARLGAEHASLTAEREREWETRIAAEIALRESARREDSIRYEDEIARLAAGESAAQDRVRELSEELESARAQYSATIRAFEQSTSWRVAAPLRWRPRNSRSVRSFYAKLLGLSQRLYRASLAQRLLRFIPYTAKRDLRNFLMRGSSGSPHSGVDTARPTESEPLGTSLVSILIPVYNHAEFLERCIDSAVSQSWPHTEVVVVDDASPDPRVADVLAKYSNVERVRLFRNERNLGISRTQNRALVESAGFIIGFLDCDDYLHPDAVRICLEHWRPDTVYSHSGRVNVDASEREIGRINFVGLPRQDYFAENLAGMYATHFKMIKREAFVRAGLFDPRFDSAQDYDLLMRIAFHYPSSAFVHVPDFVYFHRLHPGQTTEVQNSLQQRSTDLIRSEARLRRDIREGRFDKFISIVMLSYGKHTQTLDALRSLERTVSIPHEVILYDNGSDPATVAFLREYIDGKLPNVSVYYGKSNLGPARGRREALRHARGDWLIVFDNDEIAEPGWIEELLVRARAFDNVGAVNCRVVFPNHSLQFSGGRVQAVDDEVIRLELYDTGKKFYDLSSCEFREVDWCPIGATLFTVAIADFLHDGYPNVFEDAGVSFSLKRQGLRLLNAPGALVWHEHVNFRPKVEMRERYMSDRYNPRLMLKSVASFYRENGLIISDEYIWRENGLDGLTRSALKSKLAEAAERPTVFSG